MTSMENISTMELAVLRVPGYLIRWHRNFDVLSLVTSALVLSLPLIRYMWHKIRFQVEQSVSSNKIRVPDLSSVQIPLNETTVTDGDTESGNQSQSPKRIENNYYFKIYQCVSQIIYLMLLLCHIASILEILIVYCESERIFKNFHQPMLNVELGNSLLAVSVHLILYGIVYGKYLWYGEISITSTPISHPPSSSRHYPFPLLLHSISFVYFFIQATCTAAQLSIVGSILTGSSQFLLFRPYLLFLTFLFQSYFLLKHFVFLVKFSVHRQQGDFQKVNSFDSNDKNDENIKYGRKNSGFLSAATFFWFIPILKLGYRKCLTIEDLGLLPDEEDSEYQYQRFYNEYKKINIERYRKTFLWRVCWMTYRRSLLIGAVIKVFSDLSSLVGPMSIEYILTYISRAQEFTAENFTNVTGNETVGPKILIHIDGNDTEMDFLTIDAFFQNAYVVAVIVLIATLLQSTFSNNFNHLVLTEGIHLKTALNCCIYQKALRMPVNNGKVDAGIITNYMALDSTNIFQLFTMMHYLWCVPIKICVLLILLYRQMGISAICGAMVFFLVAPFQYYCSWKISKIQKSQMNITDKRISKTTELFMGIKLLKLMGWELSFANKVKEFRDQELKYLKWDAIFIAFNTFATQASAIFVTVVTFGIFRYIENQPLKASTVFTSIALFNQITVPLYIVPLVIPMLISAIVSHGRLVEYFSSPDLEPNATQWEDSTNRQNEPKSAPIGGLPKPRPKPKPAISCQIGEGKFAWYDQRSKDKECTLCNVNVTIPSKRLTIVVGSVGSGKSTLLASLIGETRLIEGRIHWRPADCTAFGYVPSSPWILNVSLQENITLGREPFQEKRYQEIIKACCLQADIDLMPNGDQTIIGERGLTLSGGQRQRVALARAIYSSAPTLVLDDSLSALDPIVGYSVFDNAIVRLVTKHQSRTVILATHKHEYLSRCDYVVVVESGTVKNHGTLEEVEKENKSFFYHRKTMEQQENIERSQCLGKTCLKTTKERRKMERNLSKKGEFRGSIKREVSKRLSRPIQRQLSWDTSTALPIHDCPVNQLNEMETSVKFDSSRIRRTPSSRAAVSRVRSDGFRKSIPKVINACNEDTISSCPINPALERSNSRVSNVSQNIIEEEEEDTVTEDDDTEKSDDEIEDESVRLNRQWIPETPTAKENETETEPTPTVSFHNEIPMAVYKTYLKAHTYHRAILVFVLIILNQTFRVVSDFWLANWTDNEEQKKESIQVEYYIQIYMLLSAISVAISLATNLLAQLIAIRAVRKLHHDLLERLVRFPLRFFDKTPIGRIINRFTNDINVIDKILPVAIPVLFRFFFLCLSAIIVNIIISPYFLWAAIPILIVYYYLQKIFRCTSRQLQRLESSSKSPIISHFNETVDGLVTIRGLREQEMFTEKFYQLLDANNLCFLMANSGKCFLGIFLDYYGGIILFLATTTSITAALYWNVHSAFVGLSMTYTLLVPVYLNWLVRNLAQTEMNMNSVERIYDYMQLETEKSCINGLVTSGDADDWLKNGEIEYQNVTIRYEANLEPIVYGANIHIAPGEKIGICGRTGSGKSSLIGALFRINQICEGKILIDGHDITKICPNKLRSRLAIIPQDLIVFTGTIRDNLDPSGQYTDKELYEILEDFRLDRKIKSLDEEIDNGESQFSSGERQLLCCARAFLRKSPILIMDESTSMLDLKSEQLVLKQIFKSKKTVIVIAHRVLNITSFDKVAVFNGGKIVEFDSPQQLLKNPNSMFYTLYHKRI